MGSGNYAIERRTADLLRVALSGDIDASLISACEAEVRAQLAVVRKDNVRVLVDLTGVTHYSLDARDALTAMQVAIGRKAAQTAYCAETSEGRSLALWVAHMGGDQIIRSFRTGELALAWLGGEEGPSTGVRPLASTRDGNRRPRRKTA